MGHSGLTTAQSSTAEAHALEVNAFQFKADSWIPAGTRTANTFRGQTHK
jgi:hypothetical protein